MRMALLPSSTALAISPSKVMALSGPQCQLRTCMSTSAANCHVSNNPSRRMVTAQFRIPDKAKMQMNAVNERLWKFIPDSVGDFPWKKTEDQALQVLLSLGRETFKWSFLAWFFLSFLSDIVFTISRNQELVLPFGLLAGCFLSDFMKETSEELFEQSQVKVNQKFLGFTSIFVALKLISVFFGLRGRIFVAHLANGGLMQILWLWKRLQEDESKDVGTAP